MDNNTAVTIIVVAFILGTAASRIWGKR